MQLLAKVGIYRILGISCSHMRCTNIEQANNMDEHFCEIILSTKVRKIHIHNNIDIYPIVFFVYLVICPNYDVFGATKIWSGANVLRP